MKKTIYILAATTMLLLGSSKLQAQCNYGNFSTRFTLGGFSKNYLLGTKITVTTGGVLQSLSFDSRTAGTGQVQMALYENVGGLPGNLVAQSGITNIVAGDMNLSVGAGINIAAGDYWIMAVYNVDGDKTGSYNNFGDNSLVVRYTSFEIGNAIPTNASGFVSYSGQTFNYWVVTNCGSSCTPTTSTTNAAICAGGNYSFDGKSYNAAGTYSKTGLTNAEGCDSSATLNLSIINSLPSINGAKSVCIGSLATFTNGVAGGVWSSNNNRATVNETTGVVTAVNAGTASISYKYTKGGCKLTTTTSLAVNALPSVPNFYYAAGTPNPQKGPAGAFCANKTFTMVGTPSGGLWSSTGVITVDASSGDVNTGSSAGAATLTYTYTNTNGCSNSRTIAGTVADCAARGVNGIENGKLKMENDFTMYPNPAKTFIRLNVETLMGAGIIVVTDLYGKQIKTQTLSMGTNTIDVSKLAKGIYFVSTITNEGKTTKKLVVE